MRISEFITLIIKRFGMEPTADQRRALSCFGSFLATFFSTCHLYLLCLLKSCLFCPLLDEFALGEFTIGFAKSLCKFDCLSPLSVAKRTSAKNEFVQICPFVCVTVGFAILVHELN